MENPFLSVVVPTYNRKDSLRVTLDAFGRQRPLLNAPAPSFEVVVISDGSTDETEAFLAAYAASAPYPLRWFQQPNGGPARARNRGVEEARGKVIVFVDDDVEPAPHFLATHAAHHEKDEKIVVIGPMSPDPALRGREPVWIAWEHEMLQKQYRNFVSQVWGVGPPHFYTGNASLQRCHILAVGGFNEKFQRMEDIELAVRMAQNCDVHFVFDPNTNALHRPMRTFASWLKVPYAYGGRMVARATTGEEPWKVVADAWYRRSRVTQRLAGYVLPRPNLSSITEERLKVTAERLYALPGEPCRWAALSALSALYNIRLLEGARDEIGSWPALWSAIQNAKAAPSSSLAPSSVEAVK